MTKDMLLIFAMVIIALNMFVFAYQVIINRSNNQQKETKDIEL